jgi:tetratricopeptide (TPR) repeat protein
MWMVLLLALGALAEDPAFAEGRALYDQLEYEQAVFRFQEVALRPELAPEDQATALTWLGLSFAGTGNMDAARRAFVDAASLKPELTLPVEVAPALQQLFDDAHQEALRRRAEARPSPTPNPVPPPGAVADEAVPVVGGAGLAGLSFATWEGAKDKQLFQADAKAQLDAANLELGAAWVLMPVGAAVAATATWFLLDGAGP